MKLSEAQQRLLVELSAHEIACAGSTELFDNEMRTAMALVRRGLLTMCSHRDALLTADGWREALRCKAAKELA